MTDLTAAEQRRFAINGVQPTRMSTALVAGIEVRLLHYPDLPNRPHPDDAALWAKIKMQLRPIVGKEIKE